MLDKLRCLRPPPPTWQSFSSALAAHAMELIVPLSWDDTPKAEHYQEIMEYLRLAQEVSNVANYGRLSDSTVGHIDSTTGLLLSVFSDVVRWEW